MAEKVSVMVIDVDLQCPSCYKKIKRTLCKFPQIRNQVYDEKTNTVVVSVVCCSPEVIRDKLLYKGGKTIKGIQIKEKQKEPEKPKVVVVEKPKETEKPKPEDKPKETQKPKPETQKPKPEDKPKETEKPKPEDKPKDAPKPKGPEPAPNPPPSEPAKLVASNTVNGFPPVYQPMAYYGPSYDGYVGAPPYYQSYGVPPPPPPQPSYDGYYGYGYGHSRGGNFNRCDSYFSEENPSACSIM